MGVLAAAAATTLQLACNALLLDPATTRESILMVELPLPLISALLFLQGKLDGAWTLLIMHTLAMTAFWTLDAQHLLLQPTFYMAVLLINFGALGTFAAYTLFRQLRKIL